MNLLKITGEVLHMNYQYDVCFSFASEQVAYVEKVYTTLKATNIKVFFDRASDIEVELWGSNLLEQFYNVYKKKSRFCVMFISKEYERKAWTRFERRSALERAFGTEEIYILPVRFDKTELPGFHGATKYIDATEKSPEELANIIIQKIDMNSDMTEPIAELDFSSLAEQISHVFSENSSTHIVQFDGENRILIYRNPYDQKEMLYAAIFEKNSSSSKISVLNFGLFPNKNLQIALGPKELLDYIKEGFKGNESAL